MSVSPSGHNPEANTGSSTSNNNRRSNFHEEELENHIQEGNQGSYTERGSDQVPGINLLRVQEQLEFRRREQRRQQFERRRREVEREFVHQTDRFSVSCSMCRTFVYTLRIQQATFEARLRQQQEDFEKQLQAQRDEFGDLINEVYNKLDQLSDSDDSDDSDDPDNSDNSEEVSPPLVTEQLPNQAAYQGPSQTTYGESIPGPSFLPSYEAHFGPTYTAPYPQQYQPGYSYQQPVTPQPFNQYWRAAGPAHPPGPRPISLSIPLPQGATVPSRQHYIDIVYGTEIIYSDSD